MTLDPEVYGPKNPFTPGCWMCMDYPPTVKLDHIRLCAHCLARWFPSRSVDWVLDWLERQVAHAVRLQAARQKSHGRQLVLV